MLEKPKVKSSQVLKNTLWALRLIARLSPVFFASNIIVGALVATLPFARSRLFSQLIDNIISSVNNNSSSWLTVLLYFFLAQTIISLLFFLQSHFSRLLDLHIQAELRKKFIKKISSLNYHYLEDKEIANLINKVDEESIWRIRDLISRTSELFTNITSLSAVTFILLPRYPLLWIILLLSQIPQYLVEKKWTIKDWQLFNQLTEKNKLGWDLNYQLRNKNHISELKINNAVNFIFQKYRRIFDANAYRRIALRNQKVPIEVGLLLFSSTVYFFTLINLIQDTKSGLITIGLFTFYFDVIRQTADFFRGSVFSMVAISEQSFYIANFRKIMSLKNTIIGGISTIHHPIPPEIEFKNVSFRYPGTDKYIFQNLNLTIESGKEIAIVGPNGAGKSTLIKLLCQFYHPTKGEIFINGINLKKLKLHQWYQQLAYLAQEFNSYWNLSLKDNVIIGAPQSPNPKKVNNALRKADALSFAQKYPKGINTMMSIRYGGVEPSWGQWQKIAIARIFYRNSPITILDEPTASIDAISEYKIFNRLYRQMNNKTVIIVSHRFSTVRNAQRIIVIDKGRIIEQGSHQELVLLKGLYAHSFKLQAEGYR